MVAALLDTNILIDLLLGVPQAQDEMERYAKRAISIITWMEVLVGAGRDDAAKIRAFLRDFELLGIDGAVAERAVALRQGHGIKLPDAIIWATAQTRGLLFVTRNTKDFPSNDPAIRSPYVLH